MWRSVLKTGNCDSSYILYYYIKNNYNFHISYEIVPSHHFLTAAVCLRLINDGLCYLSAAYLD